MQTDALLGVKWWEPHPDSSSTHRLVKPGAAASRIPFAAVVAFTFILLLSPQNWFPALAPLRIALLSVGVALAFLVWQRWTRREPLLPFTRETIVAAMILFWAFLTMPLSYWPGGSLTTLTQVYLRALLIFWLLANVVTTARRFRLLLTVLVLCTVPLAYSAVKNFATGKYFLDGATSFQRIAGFEAGLTENPNDMALLLNLLIPLGLALLSTARSTFWRAALVIIIIADAAAVILTFSRAGFLGLVTIAILTFVKRVRRPGTDRTWAVMVLALVILSLPLLPSNYGGRVATVMSIDSDPTGSAQARWRDNVAALRYVMAHPIIGAGIGMDTLALNQMRGVAWSQVHNIYLQYAVDLGLPGLTLFLLLFRGAFQAVRSAKRRAAEMLPGHDVLFFAEGVELSLIAFAIAGLLHPVAYNFHFYYMAGLALATRTVVDDTVGSRTMSDNDPGVERFTALKPAAASCVSRT